LRRDLAGIHPAVQGLYVETWMPSRRNRKGRRVEKEVARVPTCCIADFPIGRASKTPGAAEHSHGSQAGSAAIQQVGRACATAHEKFFQKPLAPQHPSDIFALRFRTGDGGFLKLNQNYKIVLSMAGQRIRIRLKAFDHRVIDQSARDIADTVNAPALASPGPSPCRPELSGSPCNGPALGQEVAGNLRAADPQTPARHHRTHRQDGGRAQEAQPPRWRGHHDQDLISDPTF